MTRRLHANNISTTLVNNITSSQTTIVVTSATGLPAIGTNETYRLTLSTSGGKTEIVIVTDDASSPTLTVTRGAEGTTAQPFTAGSGVELRETADSFDRKQDQIATAGDVIDFGNATTLEVPNSAAPTLNAAGQVAVDTTVTDYADGMMVYRAGSTDYGVVAVPRSALVSPTNNYVVTYDSGLDQFKLAAGGGGGGSGDVVGPSSATDNAIVRFDSTTGKLIQDSVGILDDNGNLSTNNMSPAYATTATAAGTTVLTVASTQQQFFTGSTTQTVTLPVTSTLALGYQFRVVNNSSGNVTVQSSGANSIQVMAGSTSAIFTCILTSGTTAASWSVAYFAAGGGGSPGGSTTQVQYNNAGAFGADSGFTYAGSGTATLSTQISVANLRMSGNTLISTDTNGNITLTPNGTGIIDMSGSNKVLKLPTGSTANRPTGVAGYIRYNTSTARPEATVGTSYSTLITEAEFSGAGLMTYGTAGAFSITALGTNVAAFISTPSSANLRAALTDETGTGAAVFASTPTLITPILGTPTSGTLTNCDGLTVAGGGTGRASHTAYAVICGGTTSTAAQQSVASVGNSGDVLTSAGAGALPTWAAPSGGGITWTEVTGTSQSAAVNNAYIANNAGLVTVTLPATAAVGNTVEVVGKGAGLWRLTANTGQTIKMGSSTTTSAGSLTGTSQYDAIEVVCITANTTWVVRGPVTSGYTIA